MLILVFDASDNGLDSLICITDDGLQRVKGVTPGTEKFWTKQVSDLWATAGPGFHDAEAFISLLTQMSGLYTFYDVVEGRTDEEFDAVYDEAVSKYGETTFRMKLRSRPR